MKRKYYIIGIFTLILLIISTHKTKTVYDKFAKTTISNKEYDFGMISSNDTVIHTFVIKNISNNPFVIAKILPSCTCTIIDSIPKKLYKKDESLNIKTQFIPKTNQKGHVENIVLVECDSEDRVIKLILKGEIK